MERADGTCDHTSCTVLSDQRCFEGVDDVGACPHFHVTEIPEDIGEETAANGVDGAGTVEDLPAGDKLTIATCTTVTHDTHARVVVIAGREDSGKTTLLASIYEAFQSGPFAGYNFAGSKTLPGLERRCFLSRIASRRQRPDTERSKGAFGETLLHLRVRLADNSEPIRDLLFTDLAGEDFRQAMNSTEHCKKLLVVRRADHFVLLIDGDKVSVPTQRHAAFADSQMLLRRFLDSGMLDNRSRVDVLLTKYDRWRDQLQEGDFRLFVHHVSTSFTTGVAPRVFRLRFGNVAARPENCSDLSVPYELDRFFPTWVQEVRAADRRSAVEPVANAGREYDRYQFRRFRNRR